MAIFNAWCDRVPMLILGATGPVDAARAPAVDRLDPHRRRPGRADPQLTSNGTTSPARSPAALRVARPRLRRSRAPRRRAPVYVCLDARAAGAALARAACSCPTPTRSGRRRPHGPARRRRSGRAADPLGRRERPLILFGRGSRATSDWETRVALAERLGARVLTDLKAGAAFPTDHPLHAGPPGTFLSKPRAALSRAPTSILAPRLDRPRRHAGARPYGDAGRRDGHLRARRTRRCTTAGARTTRAAAGRHLIAGDPDARRARCSSRRRAAAPAPYRPRAARPAARDRADEPATASAAPPRRSAARRARRRPAVPHPRSRSAGTAPTCDVRPPARLPRPGRRRRASARARA